MRVWLDSTKEGKSCVRCGQDDPDLLDYHHRDPSTKCFKIADAIRLVKNRNKVLAEIAKCDLLCANCHRKLHKLQKRQLTSS